MPVVPIEFLDLLADDGWEPFVLDAQRDGATWSEGGTLAEAPVDVAATFDGAVRRATRIDPTFGMTGVRLAPGARVPRHRHDRSLLLLVFGGAVTVEHEDEDGAVASAEVGTGRFCVIDEDTPHALVAGLGGATLLASLPQPAEGVATCWYPDEAWVPARAGRART